jgi:chromosomal replication initiation ATPase DnaA
MTRQLRLSLKRPPSHARADFVEGPSNAQARAALDAWPAWPGGALVLFGPEGLGKSHLARGWAEARQALTLDRQTPDLEAAAGRAVLLEDVDQGMDDEALFHLINMAGREGASLLMTARASTPSSSPKWRRPTTKCWKAYFANSSANGTFVRRRMSIHIF